MVKPECSKFKFQFGQEFDEQSSPESLRESPSFDMWIGQFDIYVYNNDMKNDNYDNVKDLMNLI